MATAIPEMATAFPAFIGYSEKAEAFGEPVWIASLAQYRAAFGGAGPAGFHLHDAIRLFYDNGGDDAFVLSVGAYDSAALDPASLLAALDRIGREAGPTLLLAPDALRLARADYHDVVRAMIGQCASLKDRFAILDVHGGGDPAAWSVAASAPLLAEFRGALAGLDGLGYGAAYYPWLVSSAGTAMPPSGAVAGIYRQVDHEAGVWKAPANVLLRGDVADVAIRYRDADQAELNAGASGVAINPIRVFSEGGPRLWGARTLDRDNGEFRYVPVRRTAIFIEASLRSGLQTLAFEPNGLPAWAAARRLAEDFLIGLWRKGAFPGSTPREAFYVRCGLGATMTQDDIDNGRLVVEIGMAPLRPAEFLILRITQIQRAPDE